MEGVKLKKIRGCVVKTVSSSFDLLVTLTNVCIRIFIIFGSVAAILLLYKMFPDLALTILKPMSTIFSLIIKIVKVVAVFLGVSLYAYIIISLTEYFDKLKKEREAKKKKFMDDLVKKLKREIKNK